MSNIACVFAHPDDESFGPGGTIALLAQQNDVYIVCCTDGDHQEKGLKNIRAQELLASAKILGAKEVRFLNFVDGDLSNNQYHKLASALQKELDDIQPETVITFSPDGVSGHIDHMVVTSVVNYLFPRLPYLNKIMYSTMSKDERSKVTNYFVFMPDGFSRDEIDEIIDISTVWDTKVAAMRAHVSQKSDCDWILDMLKNLPKEDRFLVRSK